MANPFALQRLQKSWSMAANKVGAMSKRLYVGNLAYGVSSEELRALFAPFGTIKSAQVLIERESGRSRGFGFVEMESDLDADSAIEQLDGTELMGRRLNVNEAKPKSPSGGFGGGGRGLSGGRGVSGGGY